MSAFGRVTTWGVLVGGGALLLGACPSDAAPADRAHAFAITQKPYRDALIDLALQAGVSLLGASSCGVSGQTSLSGTFTLDQALGRLLARAPCGYRVVDHHTVRVFALPPPRREGTGSAPPVVSELLITATKRPASAGELPAGVSVVSREQIRATGSADASEIAAQVAGVITTNLGPGRDKLLIRGLSDGAFTGRARTTVGTYLDDTPINSNAPDPDLRLSDVERVEVVRGPQGALYGSGALSGVYRVVTRKPEFDRKTGGLAAELGWTEGGSPSREVEGFLNAPLVEGASALRVAAYYDLQGGYLDDVSMRLSNVDRTLRVGGRAALRVQVADNWLADVAVTVQHLRSNDTQYVTPTLGYRRRANRVQETHNNDFAEASVALHGDLGWSTLSSTTAYVRHAYSSQYDASAALDLFSGAGADLGLFLESARVKMIVQDLVLTSPTEGRLRWLLGVNGVRTIADTPSALRTRSAGGALATAYEESRRDGVLDLAIYGEASYQLGGGWTLTAGARAFTTRLKTGAVVDAPSPGVSRLLSRERRFSGVSPKVALQRELGPDAIVYALISEGFRAGGVNSAGLAPPRASRATFEPDRLRNYEVGLKTRLSDRGLDVRAAVFVDDWRNIQTDQYLPSGLAYTANVGDARILGLEAEVARTWDFGLSVHGALLVSHPTITRANPDFAARLGNGLPGTPRFSGSVLAIYERAVFHSLKVRTVSELSYVGHSSLTFDPALSPQMGNYLKTRLAIELASDRWTVGVSVSNPTNASGDTFAYGNPFSFGQVRQVTPQRPRTIDAHLSATF